MEQPDPTIHQPIRLKIMAALSAHLLILYPIPKDMLEFVRLKSIVGATEGNLGAHIGTLETAGYLTVVKDFNGKKPRTRVALTKTGRRAFEDYISYLREIVEAASP